MTVYRKRNAWPQCILCGICHLFFLFIRIGEYSATLNFCCFICTHIEYNVKNFMTLSRGEIPSRAFETNIMREVEAKNWRIRWIEHACYERIEITGYHNKILHLHLNGYTDYIQVVCVCVCAYVFTSLSPFIRYNWSYYRSCCVDLINTNTRYTVIIKCFQTMLSEWHLDSRYICMYVSSLPSAISIIGVFVWFFQIWISSSESGKAVQVSLMFSLANFMIRFLPKSTNFSTW